MDLWTAAQALILGVVEGLTEFLPISSTGHQIIVADLLDFGGERAMAFNIIIQLAAILAVVWEFRGKILEVVFGLTSQPTARRFTGNLLLGQNVSQRPWFNAGKKGPYVGDAHDAVLLDKHLREPGSKVPLRFMDYASPVRGQDSVFKGVISAHVNWAWVQDIIRRSSPASCLRSTASRPMKSPLPVRTAKPSPASST